MQKNIFVFAFKKDLLVFCKDLPIVLVSLIVGNKN